MRQRIDLLLVERGLVPSWEQARALIMAGEVLANESVVDKDLSPSWRSTAEARVTGICDESPNESLDVLLKYPPAPEWLIYASEDATNTEVATWVGQFRAHVDPSSDSEGVHLAYTSPPDITDAVIVAVVAILADIAAVVAGVVFLLL